MIRQLRILTMLSVVAVCALQPLAHTHAALWSAEDFLVPCGNAPRVTQNGDQICYEYGGATGECSWCDLVTLGQNIINLLVFLSVVVATLLFVNAGVLYLGAAGNPGNISRAHRIFVSTLVGLIIILAAWLIIDVVLKTLYAEDTTGWGPWNEILCSDTIQAPTCITVRDGLGTIAAPLDPGPPGTTTPPVGPTTTPPVATCTDPAALAARYGARYPYGNDPALDTLISCYLGDPAVSAITDRNQLYTFERSNTLCNYTNGNRVCGACAHSVNSCHYGRGSGKGAQAVDFNASAGNTESQLYQRIVARRGVCGGVVLFERDHTHISLSTCGSR